MILFKLLETQPLIEPKLGLFIWTIISVLLFSLLSLFLYKLYKYITRKTQ
jgi:hypothetical protein